METPTQDTPTTMLESELEIQNEISLSTPNTHQRPTRTLSTIWKECKKLIKPKRGTEGQLYQEMEDTINYYEYKLTQEETRNKIVKNIRANYEKQRQENAKQIEEKDRKIGKQEALLLLVREEQEKTNGELQEAEKTIMFLKGRLTERDEMNEIAQKTIDTAVDRIKQKLDDEWTNKLAEIHKQAEIKTSEISERDEQITQLLNKLKEQAEENEKLMQKFSEAQKVILEPSQLKQTYATQAAKIPYKPAIIIKSKDKPRSTLELRKQLGKISLEKINIKNCQPLKEGGLEITCENDAQIEALQASIKNTEELGEQVIINKKEERGMRIIIFSVPKETTAQEIQKSIEKVHGHLRLFKVIKTQEKVDIAHITIEIEIQVAREIVQRGRLLLNFQSLPVKKYVSLQRCYRCQRFGHASKNCISTARKNKTRFDECCEYCAGEHLSGNCKLKEQPTKYKCVNCVDHNANRNTEFPTDHRASDKECQSYLIHLRSDRKKSKPNS